MKNPPILLLLFFFLLTSSAALRPKYYSQSCPEAETIAREVLRQAMARETRSIASVMRLQFHDCFVNGCDGSVLLDDTEEMLGEKTALSNVNSLRSFEVVDEIKAAVEYACPRVVSCADLLVMAARDAVLLSGGPKWEVKLGRKDSLKASLDAANAIMPSPRANATALMSLFAQLNLSVRDLVALSGSHSIGKARCFSIVYRLYNQSDTGRPDPSIDPAFREYLDDLCPQGGNEEVTGGMDATPEIFDNRYYKDLIGGKGFLNSDETLYTCTQTRGFVEAFARNETEFYRAFIEGMIKMGNLESGLPGEVRTNCRVVNKSDDNLVKDA